MKEAVTVVALHLAVRDHVKGLGVIAHRIDHLARRKLLEGGNPGGCLELLAVEGVEDGGGHGGVALYKEELGRVEQRRVQLGVVLEKGCEVVKGDADEERHVIRAHPVLPRRRAEHERRHAEGLADPLLQPACLGLRGSLEAGVSCVEASLLADDGLDVTLEHDEEAVGRVALLEDHAARLQRHVAAKLAALAQHGLTEVCFVDKVD